MTVRFWQRCLSEKQSTVHKPHRLQIRLPLLYFPFAPSSYFDSHLLLSSIFSLLSLLSPK